MLKLIAALILSLSCAVGAAKSFHTYEKVRLFDFEISGNPSAGQSSTIFVHLNSNFVSPDEVRPIIRAYFDWQALPLLRATEQTWIMQSPLMTSGQHTLSADVWIEDKDESDALRAAIHQLTREISVLDEQIAIEEDLAEKVILEGRRNQKTQERSNLYGVLDSLKRYVGSDQINFTVP